MIESWLKMGKIFGETLRPTNVDRGLFGYVGGNEVYDKWELVVGRTWFLPLLSHRSKKWIYWMQWNGGLMCIIKWENIRPRLKGCWMNVEWTQKWVSDQYERNRLKWLSHIKRNNEGGIA